MNAKEKEANGGIEADTKEEEAEQPEAEDRRRKYVWIVILLAVIGGFIGHISIQLQNYLRFRMLEVDGESKVDLVLPDLIMCPPSYFWNERAQRYKWNNTISYRDKIFSENLRNAYFAILDGTLNTSHMSDEHYWENLQLTQLTFLPILAVNEIGSTIPDVLIFCEFGGHSCDIRNFSTFLHHEFGVCIRFHERPDTLQKFGVGGRNGLIANFRLAQSIKQFDFSRNYFFTRNGYKFFIQRKNTWQNVEKILHASTQFFRTFFGVYHTHYTRLDTMTSPCRADSRRRLCYLERAIGLTCKEFLIDAYALMQMYAQNSLVEKCQCISYEWPLTEDQKKYPSCHALPNDVFLNAGFLEENGTFVVVLANKTKVNVDRLMDIKAVRKRIQCYRDAKKAFESVRLEESYQSTKERMWSPLCVEDRYTYSILTQDNPMKAGQLFSKNKEVFLLNWDKQMAALNESGINQTCVFADKVKELLKAGSCASHATFSDCIKKGYTNDTSWSSDDEIRKLNQYIHQIVFFPNALTATVRRQVYEYPSGQFFADVGGLSGVWIGICVLSVFDLVESTVKSLRDYFRK